MCRLELAGISSSIFLVRRTGVNTWHGIKRAAACTFAVVKKVSSCFRELPGRTARYSKGGVQRVRSAVERRLVTDCRFSGDQKVRLTQLK